MLKKVGILGGLALVALLLVTFTGSALAAPPGPNHYGFGFLDRVTLQRVATLLGATPADLTAQLQQGKTLAALAQAKGVAEQTLADMILQPFKDRLALQVKYGYLTQEQADALLQAQQARVKDLITATPGTNAENGFGGCHGSGWGGPGGMMGTGMTGFGGQGMMGTGGSGMMGWW